MTTGCLLKEAAAAVGRSDPVGEEVEEVQLSS